MKLRKGLILVAVTLCAHGVQAQAFDEERMNRDIEVAENVLSTLVKQEMGQQRHFFGMDIRGTYQQGYGVTFRLPASHAMPFVISIDGDNIRERTVIGDGPGYRYSYRTNNGVGNPPEPPQADGDEDRNSIKLKDKVKEKRVASNDSAQQAFYNSMIRAAQDFILDYGDFISQLGPNEKIVVTNQGDRPHFYFHQGKRRRISVEGTRADVAALKSGKISREQALKKLVVVNTESVETREQDMEMLSSIFTRLYRSDLSKTYFVEGNVYYERLKDYGAVFYMQMISSIERSPDLFTLPTVGLEDVKREDRDKKVAALYPEFEKDLKENILEYGRTVRSLGDNENLVFQVGLTKCKDCKIPSTLEVSIPASVLKSYGAGKIDQAAAMNRFTVKRGPEQ